MKSTLLIASKSWIRPSSTRRRVVPRWRTSPSAAHVAGKDALELPEIANQEILGEWLIPNGDCLLVSFGPYTVADKDGKAVTRERLAFIEADVQPAGDFPSRR